MEWAACSFFEARLGRIDRTPLATMSGTRSPDAARMAVRAIHALVYVAVRVVPKARNAGKVRAERAVRVVEELARIGEGVAPRITWCSGGVAVEWDRRGGGG